MQQCSVYILYFTANLLRIVTSRWILIYIYIIRMHGTKKGKVSPLQALSGLEGG
jgi:hypothetical protein